MGHEQRETPVNRLLRIRVRDSRMAVAIFIIAAVAGWLYMSLCIGVTGPEYDTKGSMLLPAAMWAAGHGITDIGGIIWISNYTLWRPVTDFTEQRTLSLDPKELPQQGMDALFGNKFTNDRLYLYYAVGITWRLFGISWPALNIFIAFVYAIMAVLVYAIFRLGMGRFISVCGVLLAMSSPLMLQVLPCIRDACKGPFILATIFVVGYLLSRPVKARPYWILSAVIGIAIGIGVGFRQDVFICVPPALFAIIFLAHGKKPLRPSARMLAGLLFTAAFLVPAWPVLTMTHDTGGNNSFYLLQGYSLPSQQEIGMQRATYAPIEDNKDPLVHAGIAAFWQRSPDPASVSAVERWRSGIALCTLHAILDLPLDPLASLAWMTGSFTLSRPGFPLEMWSRHSEQIARRYVRTLATMFPADIVSRWYGAVAYAIHDPQSLYDADAASNAVQKALCFLHLPLHRHLSQYGDYYAVLALCLLSAHRMRLGLITLGVLVYFAGYTSLSFQARHAFHLAFFGFWLPGFCLQQIVYVAGSLYSERQKVRIRLASLRAWRRPVASMLAFLAISVILLSMPLIPARLWQHRQVEAMLQRYRHCTLEPIPFEEGERTEATVCYHPSGVFSLDRMPPAREQWEWLGVPTEPIPRIMTDYLVAEFDIASECRSISINTRYDYSGLAVSDPFLDSEDRYSLPFTHGPLTVRYFCPVYRYTLFGPPVYPPVFKGLSMPAQVPLKRLYRVTNIHETPLPMNLWITGETAPFGWYQAIPLFGTWI